MCFIRLTYSAKYEHISDCHFYSRSTTPGVDNITFICAGIDQESKVFTSAERLVCSNMRSSQYFLWPGTIDFENCQFSALKRNFFQMFFNMHTFLIPNVGLKDLQMDFFRDMKNVSTLDVSQNQLLEIPSLIFFNAINLKCVDFSNNTIKNISVLAFEGAVKLETLNLSYNQLNEVDPRALALPKLHTLDLSNNNLTKVKNVFDKLVNLRNLNLSFNSIGNLEVDTFIYQPNLENLNLRRTNISIIQLGTFSLQHKLITLDLSENNLKTLNFKLFSPVLSQLKSLRMANNQLQNLNGFRNKLFPRLELLDIQGNLFDCSYLAYFMESIDWKDIHLHLDVSSFDPHRSNIRGINCDDTVYLEITTDEGNVLGIESETRIMRQHQNEPNNDYHDDLIIKISLIFLCITSTMYLILFSIANLDKIRNQLPGLPIRLGRNTQRLSKENVVEFSNDGILIN